jgi:SSS family solute:Na+ symporter
LKVLPQLELASVLTNLDWSIFALVLLATVASIIYGRYLKKNDSKESILETLLMGRQLTLPLFVFTLVATWYGGITGVTEIAFNQGIFNFVTQGFFWYLSYIVFALFLAHKIHPYQAVTLPDLIGKMFGPKSAKLSACFNFFNVLPISYTIGLGVFIQSLFGVTLLNSMLIGMGFVILYSSWGGFRAVVFSDIIQFFVMCSSVLLVLLFSISHFGGIGFLKESLPTSYFSLTGTEGLANTLIWGFIAFSTLVDPNFYQRCFAANSPKIAKKGIIISTIIWFCFDICTTFGAMYAKATIPEATANQAYIIYAIQILPEGLRGFVLGGLLATVLSTLDSYLFLAGTTISHDLAPGKIKKMNLHFLGFIVVGALSIFFALYFEGSVKAVWKTLGSYSASCLLFPVLCGHLFPGKISDLQFTLSCLSGVLFTTLWRITPRTGFLANVDELYIGILATACTLLITGALLPKNNSTRQP